MSGGSALGDALEAGFVAGEDGACDEVDVEGRLAGFDALVAVVVVVVAVANAVADVVAGGAGVF